MYFDSNNQKQVPQSNGNWIVDSAIHALTVILDVLVFKIPVIIGSGIYYSVRRLPITTLLLALFTLFVLKIGEGYKSFGLILVQTLHFIVPDQWLNENWHYYVWSV